MVVMLALAKLEKEEEGPPSLSPNLEGVVGPAPTRRFLARYSSLLFGVVLVKTLVLALLSVDLRGATAAGEEGRSEVPPAGEDGMTAVDTSPMLSLFAAGSEDDAVGGQLPIPWTRELNLRFTVEFILPQRLQV